MFVGNGRIDLAPEHLKPLPVQVGDRLLRTREIGRQESRRYQALPYPVRGVPAVTAESAVRIETLGHWHPEWP